MADQTIRSNREPNEPAINPIWLVRKTKNASQAIVPGLRAEGVPGEGGDVLHATIFYFLLLAAYSFPKEVLEYVFSFMNSDNDPNAMSSVCKLQYEIEYWYRRKIFIKNYDAMTPRIMI
ncbi:COI1, F-box [Dillenia turbinata]|uniref:COI1, F-box n=1 Tax=Dillenia turbinata TaxID=194707 RepID=A0AAN8ZDF6_9MAGN